METLQRTANRGSISTGFDIDNSCKFEADNSEELSRNVTTAGSRTTATTSMWIKRTELGTAQYLFTYGNTDNDNGRTFARFQSDDTLRVMGGNTVWLNTNRVFRDTSAWYHIVIVFDTTSGTANNRTRMYINGVEETSFSTRNNPDQNFVHGLNFQKQVIGYNSIDGGSYFSGYMTEICYQDGTASAPTEFGEYDDDSGIWIPKDVSDVASGTNGFYLDFEDGSNMGNDVSGGTDFTLNNITAADQATDTPTNNFCTWSPLWNYATSPTMTEGATKVVEGIGSWGGAKSSIGVANGKWYWELKVSSNSALTGIQTDGDGNIASGNAQAVKQTMALYYAGTMVEAYDSGGNRDDTNVTFTYNANDTYGIALDMDSSTQTISFYQNGSLITNGGNINIDGLGGNTVFPFAANNGSTTTVNFGGYTINTISSGASDENGYGTFEYAPPSGYYALCTKNLAEYG